MLRSWTSACFVTLLACSSGTGESSRAVVATEVVAALDRGEEADVIIELREPEVRGRPDRKTAIARLASDVRANLGNTLQVSHEYRHIAAIAGHITPASLERLRQDPNVANVRRVREFSGQLKESVPALGVDRVQRMFSLRGRGVRVAVLDSGIDHDHPDLKGAVVAEHCFTRGACPPWNLNEGTEANDEHGHGTAVAGVIASRGVSGPAGFAPEAELVVLKTMNAENRGVETDFLSAIDWLNENLDSLHISVLNLSIGTDALFDNALDCDRSAPTWAKAIRTLTEEGVTVIAGTGNLGSTTQLPAPACNSGVIAVGATYDADVGAQPASGTFLTSIGLGFAACGDRTTQAGQISCYSNAPARTDLVAPGGPMLTARLGGDTYTAWGTSFASAAVSGVAAVLHECNPELRPADLLGTLVATGELKMDARSGRSFPFIRAPEAVTAACPQLVVDAGAPQEPGTSPAGTAGSTPSTMAAGSGGDNGSTAPAAGSSGRLRDDDSALGRRYEGPTPAMALDARPVRSGGGGRETAGGTAMERDAGPRVDRTVRTEKVSMCSTTSPGYRGSSGGAWSLALALALYLRRRR
jgi:subtilisin family serine protease